MPVTHDQLTEGGPVFFTAYHKSGPSAGLRRLPARVLDIQGETATIELLHNQSVREVKLQHLEPDLDWLSKVYEERDKAERKRLAKQAEYTVVRTPVLDSRTPLPIPQPKVEPDPQGQLFKGTVPVDYEKVPDVPQITMSEPPVDTAADVAAYLDLGDAILKRLNTAIQAAPETERAPLETQRDEIVRRMTDTKEKGEGVSMGKPDVRTASKKDKALADIRAGMSDRKVADKYGISTGTVWNWKKVEEALATKATEKKGSFPTPYPEATRKAALEDVKAGMRIVDIAKKYGVSTSTIHGWKAGVGGGKPGPKPKVETAPAPQAAPEAPVRHAKPSAVKAQEENRRLRGALAKLLAQEPRADDLEALAEDNRRLRAIIDMWLGLS